MKGVPAAIATHAVLLLPLAPCALVLSPRRLILATESVNSVSRFCRLLAPRHAPHLPTARLDGYLRMVVSVGRRRASGMQVPGSGCNVVYVTTRAKG